MTGLNGNRGDVAPTPYSGIRARRRRYSLIVKIKTQVKQTVRFQNTISSFCVQCKPNRLEIVFIEKLTVVSKTFK